MDDKDFIIKMIEEGIENELIDFKQEYYSKEKRSDLIKDVCAFANGESKNHKFIVFGVKDTSEVCGMVQNIEDVSNINQLLDENVEPFINISVNTFQYEGKLIGYIKIHNNDDRPYVIKKQYGKTLMKGDIYIRKGATTFKALRSDLNKIYEEKSSIKILLGCSVIFISSEKGEGIVTVQLINYTNMSIAFKEGYITIRNQFSEIERLIFNTDEIPRLDEKPFDLVAKKQQMQEFAFQFESSDCIRLNFDEDGIMHYPLEIKLTFIDIENKEYSSCFEPVALFAQGNVLHKIKRKTQSFRAFLKKEQDNLIDYIIQKDINKICQILDKNCSYFELIHPLKRITGGLPEYYITFTLIKKALLYDKEIVNIFQKYGLSSSFVQLCQSSNNWEDATKMTNNL